jgi:phospholipase C
VSNPLLSCLLYVLLIFQSSLSVLDISFFCFLDVAVGDLPELTWLEPAYYTVGNSSTEHVIYADDQHPDHDVSLGDQLIKDVYEALRASPAWNKTALIITYDEHGGFFDHVAPYDGCPNPDGINTEDGFDFTRLGIRVPTIVVSPWVKKGQVIHAPAPGSVSNNGQYEHSSFPATIVHKLFQPASAAHPPPTYLNARDEWAATFESIFTLMESPRTDCPLFTPSPSFEVHQKALPAKDGSLKLTDLQKELLLLASSVSEDKDFDYQYAADHWTESEAGIYIAKRMNIFFEREVVAI